MIRSALAVGAGWLAYVVGWIVAVSAMVALGVDFTGPVGLLQATAILAALLVGAGWVAGAVAGRHPIRHAVALGIVLTEGGLVWAVAFGGDQPFLVRFGFLALIIPLTGLGGVLAPRSVGPEEEAPCPQPTPSPSSS